MTWDSSIDRLENAALDRLENDMPERIWLDGNPKEIRNLCGVFAVCLYEDKNLVEYIRADLVKPAEKSGEGE